MPNVINGTSTGSGGLITTGDDSGILNIQTNETTAIAIDDSQRVSFVAGTAALPAITTTGDTNTGIFFPAADTIAFAEGGSEAMRLDASGNLGLGVTPSAWGSNFKVIQLGLAGNVAAQTGARTFELSSNAYNNSGWKYQATDKATLYYQYDGGHAWSTAASGAAGTAITFTQAMTLDSSGSLLVGATSGSGNNERLNITSSANQTARFINTNATSGNISIVSTLGANTDNTNSYHILTATNGATRFYVYGNGTSGNASDKNLKKNIETTRDGYAEDLCKLRVVKYNWNGQEEGAPKELGWIAQEVEQVFPNLVQDGIPNENGETFKEVKTSVLPFMLLKALQEQQAIIESLTQRITALEGA